MTAPTTTPDPQAQLCSVVLGLPPKIYRDTPLVRSVLGLYKEYRKRFQQCEMMDTQPAIEAWEKCEICDSDIRVESAEGARCTNGHQFGKL